MSSKLNGHVLQYGSGLQYALGFAFYTDLIACCQVCCSAHTWLVGLCSVWELDWASWPAWLSNSLCHWLYWLRVFVDQSVLLIETRPDNCWPRICLGHDHVGWEQGLFFVEEKSC